MRSIRWLLLACSCTLVTACGGLAAPAAPHPIPPSLDVPATTSAPLDPEAASRRALAALIAEDGLAAVGMPPPGTTELRKIWAMTEMCGGIDVGEYLTKQRSWESGGVGVHDTAYLYSRAAGAEVVAEVRAKAVTCERYRGGDGKSYDVYPDLPIDRPGGLSDTYAWCEGVDGDGFLCTALLAHEDLVVKITAAGHGERTSFVGVLNSVIGPASTPLLAL